MVIVGQIIDVCIVIALAVLSWRVPRRSGVLGLFGVHFIVLFGFCAMVPVAMLFGIWQPGDYDGAESMGGCFILAFLFNCLFLPVTIAAVVRRRHITDRCSGPIPASESLRSESCPAGPGH